VTVIHRRGWSARLRADGVFEVTDPKGRTRTSRPPGEPARHLESALKHHLERVRAGGYARTVAHVLDAA
jgi:hypothetical protein